MSEERAARLRAALAARGLVWPAPLEHHESLRSTSDVVRERARAGAAEWTTVIADTQAAGRGRWGRTWASPPGGLYLSTLLRPPPEAVGLLPLVAGVAVAEALSEWGVSTELKWPNDVLARGRKLAGVLGEASSSASGVEWVALGIGVNVGAEDDSLPPAVRENATSLRAETGGSPGLEEIAAAVMVRLTVWYD
ncbi:MAG: biotin--[acetyl-CoA-carboxylase] ligase, partial [Acidobacteria bacterium RBG_16_70_10]